MTTIKVASGAARLFGEVDGEGERVVLVHAGITDARMWDPLTAGLVPGRRVVRYDMRGYGRTAAVTELVRDFLTRVEQSG